MGCVGCTDNKMMAREFRWIRISVHLGQTMNWIICGFMEVNMGDAADESMKTPISNILMMITTC